MAFDGITIHGLCYELAKELIGSRISKIAQPENYELIITCKGQAGQKRLFISANPSLPLIYFTGVNKPSPMTAPNFCMLLRKHISGGRISEVQQMGLERVIKIGIEHLDEMGEQAKKFLMIEIMGKHSNIIFCDEDMKILDAIRHVGALTSSVREVLPGRDYFIPSQEGKFDPWSVTDVMFYEDILKRPMPIAGALTSSLVGFSKVAAIDLCERAGADADRPATAITVQARDDLYREFKSLLSRMDEGDYHPVIYYNNKMPSEFSVYPLSSYSDMEEVSCSDISSMLEDFYTKKAAYTLMQQKSSDIRKHIKNLIERESKKLDLQEKQMADTKKLDNIQLYGELLSAYGHDIKAGSKKVTLKNYYNGEDVTIPLDETKSGIENSQAYFDRYAKLKRTKSALEVQLETTRSSLNYLKETLSFAEMCESAEDLEELKKELRDQGYLKKETQKGKKTKPSKPLHFVSEAGYDFYVGKNNYQNEYVTFKIANGGDWWFHAKQMPGSHVIIKGKNEELPDDQFILAAQLAAFYSSGRDSDKLEIDYIQRKFLKKPAGGPPGYLIYHTNYSMVVKPSTEGLTLDEH